MNEEAEIERLKAEWYAEIERSKIYCRAHEKLIELRDSQLKQYRLLLTRAADALDVITQFLLVSDVPLEWEENKRRENRKLIAELRKAAAE